MIPFTYNFYTNLPKLRRNSVRILPAAPMLVIGIASSIMANQAAFAFLLAYTCSVLLLLPRGEQWGSSANSPHQIRSSLIKPLQKVLFCCQVWHTNTSTHITTAQRHAPKKHIRKKQLPLAVIFKQDLSSGCRTSAFYRTDGGTSSSQVSFSSISYKCNVGTSTQTTIGKQKLGRQSVV